MADAHTTDTRAAGARGAEAPGFRTFQLRNLDDLAAIAPLDDDQLHTTRVVGSVLPFKTNNYVVEQLIDWDRVPDDPMFQLTFPQRGMLHPADYEAVSELVRRDAPKAEIDAQADRIRRSLNPHPAGQASLNVPSLDGEPVAGMQHKYRETVLFFPAQGQTCHAYCSYCFRWPQFVDLDDLKFASKQADDLVAYLRANREVTDVLFTGGDPMIMRTEIIRRYVEPLLAPDLAHVNVRFGTKAPAYWPYKFTHGAEADDLMALFEEVVAAGRHLAVMAHYSHPVELSTDVARAALRRIQATGATVRCQAPLIRHVNDSADAWAEMWKCQVDLGAVPYYMFVERDTGARNYFEVPLARAHEIYAGAIRRVSGLARTARGPSMSCVPGKVCVDDVTEIAGERVFVLKMLQAREPERANRVFFARYDESATWFDDLVPALGSDRSWFPHLEPAEAAIPVRIGGHPVAAPRHRRPVHPVGRAGHH